MFTFNLKRREDEDGRYSTQPSLVACHHCKYERGKETIMDEIFKTHSKKGKPLLREHFQGLSCPVCPHTILKTQKITQK